MQNKKVIKLNMFEFSKNSGKSTPFGICTKPLNSLVWKNFYEKIIGSFVALVVVSYYDTKNLYIVSWYYGEFSRLAEKLANFCLYIGKFIAILDLNQLISTLFYLNVKSTVSRQKCAIIHPLTLLLQKVINKPFLERSIFSSHNETD